MPEESAPEVKQDISMTREHISPQLPIEQGQVNKAVVEARKALGPLAVEVVQRPVSSEERESAWAENRPIPVPVAAGGAPDGKDLIDPLGHSLYEGMGDVPPGTESLSPLERMRMEQERQNEWTKGRWNHEIARTSENPQAIRLALRRIELATRKSKKMPSTQFYDALRSELQDRKQIYKDARNPQTRSILGLEKFGLVDREVPVRAVQPVGFGLYKASDLTQEEATTLNTLAGQEIARRGEKDKEYEAVFNEATAQKIAANNQGFTILTKEVKRTIPRRFDDEQLRTREDSCDKGEKELFTEQQIYVASILHERGIGALDVLANLFINEQFAWIEGKEFKEWFSQEAILEGDTHHGDKIDSTMRVLGLLGEGGGDRKYFIRKQWERAGTATTDRLKELIEMDKDDAKLKSWLSDDGLKAERRRSIEAFYRRQPRELQERFSLDELVEYSQMNIFCTEADPIAEALGEITPYAENRERIKAWLREKTGGDEDDTELAVEQGWDMFRMSHLSSHYDSRIIDDGPNGAPGADDSSKLSHFMSYRRREAGRGAPHGPDATMSPAWDPDAEGLPEVLVPSFFHFAIPQMRKEETVGETKSMWERWFNDGVRMRDLPWENLSPYVHRNYWLREFFGGKKETGIFDLYTKADWKYDGLMNQEMLRMALKAILITTGPWSVHGGEIQRWLASLSPTERVRVANLKPSEFRKEFVRPLQRRMMILLPVGAIASDFQAKGRIAWREYGIFPPTKSEYASGQAIVSHQPEDEKIARYKRERQTPMVLEDAGYSKEERVAILTRTINFLKTKGILPKDYTLPKDYVEPAGQLVF